MKINITFDLQHFLALTSADTETVMASVEELVELGATMGTTSQGVDFEVYDIPSFDDLDD